MGYGVSSGTRWTISAPSTSSSYPPGARDSSRTLPRITSDDSWVRFFSDSKRSSGSALFTATHWMMPVPSRNWGKQIFPPRRRLYSQPAISTVSPECRPASATATRGFEFSRLIGRSQILQALKHLLDGIERMLHIRHFLQLQKQGILFVVRAERLHGARPIDGSSVGQQRKQVRVLFPIIVMNVGGADAALQQAVGGFHSFAHVGVARIEADVQIEMRLFEEHQ